MRLRVFIRTLSGKSYETTGDQVARPGDGENRQKVIRQLTEKLQAGHPVTFTDSDGECYIIPPNAVEVVTVQEQKD
ncbi:hypothetical protein NE857_18140 [Nocardiopsis exhalans]|uniref:Uncharacterized protein n=1 Tax=Nocardiopsis exhalans TaxID=163604 RepID=A0ABY5D1Y9_9ACTN|nr:hypothetical protein [Nocardiopsis exhalans]USY17273.1 hypothetical protein NE857_18140 [Nocardiopsis exhalans]